MGGSGRDKGKGKEKESRKSRSQHQAGSSHDLDPDGPDYEMEAYASQQGFSDHSNVNMYRSDHDQGFQQDHQTVAYGHSAVCHGYDANGPGFGSQWSHSQAQISSFDDLDPDGPEHEIEQQRQSEGQSVSTSQVQRKGKSRTLKGKERSAAIEPPQQQMTTRRGTGHETVVQDFSSEYEDQLIKSFMSLGRSKHQAEQLAKEQLGNTKSHASGRHLVSSSNTTLPAGYQQEAPMQMQPHRSQHMTRESRRQNETAVSPAGGWGPFTNHRELQAFTQSVNQYGQGPAQSPQAAEEEVQHPNRRSNGSDDGCCNKWC